MKRIMACGGNAVFGWKIEANSWIKTKINHCVWQDEAGDLWDVTPHPVNIEGDQLVLEFQDIDFEPDPAATFFGKARPNQRVPLKDCRHLERACKYLDISDEALMEGNLDRCRYWTETANTEMRRGRYPIKWSTPSSMDMSDVMKTVVPMAG